MIQDNVVRVVLTILLHFQQFEALSFQTFPGEHAPRTPPKTFFVSGPSMALCLSKSNYLFLNLELCTSYEKTWVYGPAEVIRTNLCFVCLYLSVSLLLSLSLLSLSSLSLLLSPLSLSLSPLSLSLSQLSLSIIVIMSILTDIWKMRFVDRQNIFLTNHNTTRCNMENLPGILIIIFGCFGQRGAKRLFRCFG